MTASVPVDLPSVWTPADFPDEHAWSIDLSPADRQALIDYGRGGAQQDLARHFAPAAARWAAMLQRGAGFVRLRDFPIEDLTEAQIEHAYLGLGSLLGQPSVRIAMPTCSPISAMSAASTAQACASTGPICARTSTATVQIWSACCVYIRPKPVANQRLSAPTRSTTRCCAKTRTWSR